MHIWGFITLHPMTYPIADQFSCAVMMSCRYSVTVYGAVLRPTIEDMKFLFEHVH